MISEAEYRELQRFREAAENVDGNLIQALLQAQTEKVSAAWRLSQFLTEAHSRPTGDIASLVGFRMAVDPSWNASLFRLLFSAVMHLQPRRKRWRG